MSLSATKSSSSSTTFEFTKRKRWADLLIHELSEAIILVLSTDAKIWFCGHAIAELLGWSDTELIDHHFIDLLNSEDQYHFHTAFDESLRTCTEMNTCVRLKARASITLQNIPRPEVLFEVKGHPYFIENEVVARCFFAIARPYPSRNAAMVNTFLELKTENELLLQRLAELRVCAPSPPAPSPGQSTSTVYPPRSISISQASASVSLPPLDGSSSDCSPHSVHLLHDGSSSLATEIQGSCCESLGLYAAAADDDLEDESSRRKKIRKAHNAEQFVCVTCGRTDSPEWRKGPQGPKTLCNACGLRWAKEVRSKADEVAATRASSSGHDV